MCVRESIFCFSYSETAYPIVETLDCFCIERVASYKYLGLLLDEKFAFDVYVDYLLKKLRPKLGFFFYLKNV